MQSKTREFVVIRNHVLDPYVDIISYPYTFTIENQDPVTFIKMYSAVLYAWGSNSMLPEAKAPKP